MSLGSNIDPERNVPAALELLAQQARLVDVSTIYRTRPLDRPEQGMYLNGVCRIRTYLPPRALKFDCLRKVEAALGRVRTEDAFEARTIDLDIVLYGDRVIREEDLLVPDPEVAIRPFVAFPLFELAPETQMPDTGRPLLEIVREMSRDDLTADIAFTKALRARLEL